MTKTVRIKFSADIYIEADSVQSAKSKWENMPLWSEQAKESNVEFSEVLLIEDAETYEDLKNEFY